MPRPTADSGDRERLSRAGLRITAGRLAVLRLLEESDAALTAQQVFDRISASPRHRADRVTIYRTLNTLVEHDLAHRVDAGDRVYRYSARGGPHAAAAPPAHHAAKDHPHFVCDSCGDVRCLDDAEVTIRPTRSDAPDLSHLRVSQREIVLRGTCDRCSPAPAPPPSSRPKSSEKKPGRRSR